MFLGKKIVVVMLAYNAAKTLKRTYDAVMTQNVVDLGIVVDDASRDETVVRAQVFRYGYFVAFVSCPAKHFFEASSIEFCRSERYGFGCLATGLRFRLARWSVIKSLFFPDYGHH